METSGKQHKIVYTIVERSRDGKKFWLRIGFAFVNKDGSLNVHLDAMPTNGTLQIRDAVPWDETRERVQQHQPGDSPLRVQQHQPGDSPLRVHPHRAGDSPSRVERQPEDETVRAPRALTG